MWNNKSGSETNCTPRQMGGITITTSNRKELTCIHMLNIAIICQSTFYAFLILYILWRIFSPCGYNQTAAQHRLYRSMGIKDWEGKPPPYSQGRLPWHCHTSCVTHFHIGTVWPEKDLKISIVSQVNSCTMVGLQWINFIQQSKKVDSTYFAQNSNLSLKIV